MSESFFARRFLLPLVPLYRLALVLRESRLGTQLEPVRRLRYPVVSIGNLSTGGAGKTPLVIALAKALTRRELDVDVLSRGYGRQSQLAARVLEEGSAEEFGDEPLLIARETGLPVYVAAERYEAGVLAEAEEEPEEPDTLPDPNPEMPEQVAENLISGGTKRQGKTLVVPKTQQNNERALAPEPGSAMVLVQPEIVIGFETTEPSAATDPALAPPPPLIHLLDDGFQHRQLARDVDILLLNRQDWHDWLLPAGNLREPLEAARRASVIAIPDDEPELEVALGVWGWTGPVWRLRRTMKVPAVRGPVAAFCGIARPEQFFAGLEAEGVEVALRFSFPDHFTYTRAALGELLTSARNGGVTDILTTQKDLVRMGELAAIFPESMPLAAVRLRVEIEDQEEALDWLIERIKQSSNRKKILPIVEKREDPLQP